MAVFIAHQAWSSAVDAELKAAMTKYGLPLDRMEPYAAALAASDIPPVKMFLTNKDRKWEVSSALQKTIRRGDTTNALRMVAALLSTNDSEIQGYAWRRLVVTAAEDVGAGNLDLLAFTILCSSVFTPKSFPQVQWKVLAFLATQLCESVKDRSLCELSVLSTYHQKLNDDQRAQLAGVQSYPELAAKVAETEAVWKACKEAKTFGPYWKHHNIEGDAVHTLIVASDWRTEGMGKYLGISMQMPMDQIETATDLPDAPKLKGIPCYAYDMHTRVGKIAMIRLSGSKHLKPLIELASDKGLIVGEGMFYVEGGRLNRRSNGVVRTACSTACRAVILRAEGIPLDRQGTFLTTLHDLLPKLNEIRADILGKTYP